MLKSGSFSHLPAQRGRALAARAILFLQVCGIGLLVNAGCSSALPPPQLDVVHPKFLCTEPGIVQPMEMDGASRGYAYHYTIYLPPCYESLPGQVYPILYLVPGKTSGPNTWFSAGAGLAADELILSGELPPFVIVATSNTDDDMGAEAITQDLIPYIDRTYRVSQEQSQRAVAGGSLGGIAAYRIGFSHPEQFGCVGIFGSGAVPGEEEQIASWLENFPSHKDLKVFLNTGESDTMLKLTWSMIDLLAGAEVSYMALIGEGDHTYGYWVSSLPAFYRWWAADW